MLGRLMLVLRGVLIGLGFLIALFAINGAMVVACLTLGPVGCVEWFITGGKRCWTAYDQLIEWTRSSTP